MRHKTLDSIGNPSYSIKPHMLFETLSSDLPIQNIRLIIECNLFVG